MGINQALTVQGPALTLFSSRMARAAVSSDEEFGGGVQRASLHICRPNLINIPKMNRADPLGRPEYKVQ
ncbi:MAG: hypothetical protein CL569_07085 [Alphaproteobacteria bacterium]|nr:hypothetical protein [Alphaproteobacteria bacterium]